MELDAQIAQFLEFTGYACDRRTAEDFVKGNDNVERAIQAFFEDPNPLKYREARTWSESQFAAGRESARSQMDELPPYQMEEDDRESRSQLRPLGAPSRPPSREKSRSSLRIAGDLQPYGPHRPDDEDPEIAEAIRLSMEDQQTGVVGKEYVPDIEPQDRVRQLGEPVFLKPLPSNVFLPALVTILHSIPQCRELFLSRYDITMDYGENRHWWEGEPIETTRIIDRETGVDALEPFEVIYEIQRLMAFLDLTDRSYGSAGALARLNSVRNVQLSNIGAEPAFVKFIRAWQAATDRARTAYEFEYPFRSTIQGTQPGESRHLYCVDIGASDIPNISGPNLYDVLDNCFWPNTVASASGDESSLSEVAPIMVMRIAARNPGSISGKLSIPATLFADRYMESNKQLIKNMRSALSDQSSVIEELEEQLGKFDVFQYPASVKVGNASKLLHTAIEFVMKHNGDGMDISEPNLEEQEIAGGRRPSLPANQVLLRLQQVHEQLRMQIEAITEQQGRVNAHMQALKSLLTDPTAEHEPKPTKEYKLRGVGIATANHSHITYLIHPPSPSTHMDELRQETSWWRASYDTAGDKALVTKERVSEKTVLDAAGELLSETLLVYASTDILNPATNDPLPQPLQEFIALDNGAFRLELQGSPSPVEIIEGQPVEFDSTTNTYTRPYGPAPTPSRGVPHTIVSPPTPPHRSGDGLRPLLPKPQRETLDPAILADAPAERNSVPQQDDLAQEMQEVRRGAGGGVGFGEPVPATLAGTKRGAYGAGPFRIRDAEVESGIGMEGDGSSNTDSDTLTLVDVSDGEDVEMEDMGRGG